MKRSIISRAEVAEFRRGWPVLLAAAVGCFSGLTTLPFYSVGSFITPLQAASGWGRGEISSSFLYLTLVLALTAPALGYLIDRIGVRLVALVSIPLLSLVMFLISRFEGSVTVFHALHATAALVGGGATPIAYSRAVNAHFDAARGLALGISLHPTTRLASAVNLVQIESGRAVCGAAQCRLKRGYQRNGLLLDPPPRSLIESVRISLPVLRMRANIGNEGTL
jgi:hypothetical protein